MRGSDVVRKRKMISKAAHWTSNFFMKFHLPHSAIQARAYTLF